MVSGTPDLVIQQIDPDTAPANQATTVTVTVKNQGGVVAGASKTRVKVDGVVKCDQIDTPALAAGAQTTVTCNVGTLACGTRQVEACADINGQVTESDESNNCKTEPIVVSGTPDLVIQQIDPDTAPANQATTVTVTVKNQGGVVAGASKTRVKVDGVVKCDQIDTPALAAGAQTTVTCAIGSYPAGIVQVEACTDVTALLVECDESNNCKTEPLTFGVAARFYFPPSLSLCRGQQGVWIPVRCQNPDLMKGYSVTFLFDPNVFEIISLNDITIVGTRGEGAVIFTRSFTDHSVTAGIVFSYTCPPSIPAGDGDVLLVKVNVKPNAPLGATNLDLADLPPALNRITSCDGQTIPPNLDDGAVTITAQCGFVRCEADASGELNISDCIYCLAYQFAGGPAPTCMDAADCDDSGEINISDCIYCLCYQFAGCLPPQLPFPTCGPDPTSDALDCQDFPPCSGELARTRIARTSFAAGGSVELSLIPSEGDSLYVGLGVTPDASTIGLETTLTYDPSVIEFIGLQKDGFVGGTFGFFSAKDLPETGHIRVGAVTDTQLRKPLLPGSYDLGYLLFRVVRGQDLPGSRIGIEQARFVRADGSTALLTGGESVVLGSIRPHVVSAPPALSVPNPFGQGSVIGLRLDRASSVRIEVYDVRGLKIDDFSWAELPAGHHEISWAGANRANHVSPGVYYLRATLGEHRIVRKLTLMK